MHILFAASEVGGLAKTGGLADVVASLPRALARRGHDCTIVTPLYQCTRTGKEPLQATDCAFTIPVGDRQVSARLWQAKLPGSDVRIYLVEQPDYYERDEAGQGRGLYQYTLPDGQKRDYPDNCERYAFFCRSVLETLPWLGAWPDVLHIHDWQTGLVPVYLKELYASGTAPGLRERYERTRTLLTIHNIAYQGLFWHWDMALLGLDWRLFNFKQLEFHGHLNFLKAGIVFADLVTTVSQSYAAEIQTPYFGCGLEGVLAERHDRLVGIVNGADYQEWNPATDRTLASNYDADTVQRGKPACKAALQRRLGLPAEPETPVLGMVSRLVEQKGLGLLARIADTLLQSGLQLVILGEGDPAYHRVLLGLRDRHPQRLGLTLGFDEPLAHQINAGADVYLMPSLYEPSGLNQLYALKYGTVPVVRATGGLADTVVDCTPETLQAGTATGFVFLPQSSAALLQAVQRALALYQDQPEKWRQLQQNGMRQDWGWDRSAAHYEKLYAQLCAPKE